MKFCVFEHVVVWVSKISTGKLLLPGARWLFLEFSVTSAAESLVVVEWMVAWVTRA